MLEGSRSGAATDDSQDPALPVQNFELRPTRQTRYRQSRSRGSSRARNGRQHLNNHIVVAKTAENPVGRTPSIRLRDTESGSGVADSERYVAGPHPFDPPQGY